MADPGFPVGGGVDLVGGGVDSRCGYISKILYVENEMIWTLGGRAPGMPPRSANVLYCKNFAFCLRNPADSVMNRVKMYLKCTFKNPYHKR